jgi:hypothetical protein
MVPRPSKVAVADFKLKGEQRHKPSAMKDD